MQGPELYRLEMARKLKSDQMLFMATILLVCLERRHGLQRLGRRGHGAVRSPYCS